MRHAVNQIYIQQQSTFEKNALYDGFETRREDNFSFTFLLVKYSDLANEKIIDQSLVA